MVFKRVVKIKEIIFASSSLVCETFSDKTVLSISFLIDVFKKQIDVKINELVMLYGQTMMYGQRMV